MDVVQQFEKKVNSYASELSKLNERVRTLRSTLSGNQSAYTILTPNATWKKAQSYLEALKSGTQQPGKFFKKQLGSDVDFAQLDSTNLLETLLKTKLPQIFAESAVKGDGRDWNIAELSILGDLSFAVPVTIFDNGAFAKPEVHPEPFQGTLLFTCGALLRPDFKSADWPEVVKASSSNPKELDKNSYLELYERRLVPCFQYCNDRARRERRKAFVTIPGLGCGQFAGCFMGRLGSILGDVLCEILSRHGSEWPNLHAVYYDAFKEGEAYRDSYHGIMFICQPLGKSGENGRCQLCRPQMYEGSVGATCDDFSSCDLYSFVAWDHVSWPGNDYWQGDRATDDGVKAAATDSMYRFSGVEGRYDADQHKYMPPEPFKVWIDVLKKNNVELDTSSLRMACNL